MTKIEPGDRVIVTDAHGLEHSAVARSGVETAGHSFPVVWVELDGGSSGHMPWPVESVRCQP